MSNIINYAKGLLTELEGAIRNGEKTIQADIRAELSRIREGVHQAIASGAGVVPASVKRLSDAQSVEDTAARDLHEVGTKLDAALDTATAKPAADPAAK
ncbi:hypothetical protein [Kitasatospora sp. GP82]|uniref:hypothetical protein n=1 Tax=Kitasatospora sp. GP82 TaxID=3035089 RepID=UPI0024733DF3|nr:hypothetical protein [Kitasatospora sp. GP82]MDH6123438.1 hypothetical protein [Kitasatospora sp. GP82]